MLAYPVTLTPDEDTLLVTCPDLPEVTTFGDDEAEALAYAVDAIETMISVRMDEREAVPSPSPPAEGQHLVHLPALTSAKILLYQEIDAQDVSRPELARRLHWYMPQVDRLFDLNHRSRLDQIEAAFAALGKRLAVESRAA